MSIHMCRCVLYKYAHKNETTCVSCESHVWLFVTPWSVSLQAPLSMGFPRQKYWSGLSFPPPGDLPDPGIEPMSPVAHTLQADSLPLSHWHLRYWYYYCYYFFLFYAASQYLQSMSSPHKHWITGNVSNGMEHCEYQVLPPADRLLHWAAAPSCLALRLCTGFPGSWLARPPVTRTGNYRFVSSSAQVCLYPAINSCAKECQVSISPGKKIILRYQTQPPKRWSGKFVS